MGWFGMTVQTYLGDCLDIMPSIGGGEVDMVMVDLPYGTTRNRWDSCIPLEPLWDEYKRILSPKGVAVFTCQMPFTAVLGCSNMEWLRYSWVWKKSLATGFLNANRAPLKIHEDILVFSPSAPPYNPQGLKRAAHKALAQSPSSNYGKYKVRTNPNNYGNFVDGLDQAYTGYPTTVLEYAADAEHNHPTQKPVALMEYLIRTYTDEGMTVLDNCMGSGTTGVAAVRTGRDFIGIERDPGYYELAVERISKAEYVAKTIRTLDSWGDTE